MSDDSIDASRLVSGRQVARLTGLSAPTVTEARQRGTLRSVEVAGRPLYRIEDVRTWREAVAARNRRGGDGG